MHPLLQSHLKLLKGKAGWAALNLKTGQSIEYQNRVFLAASTIKLPILAVYAQDRFANSWSHPAYSYRTGDYVEDSPYFESLSEGSKVSWDSLAEWMMIRSDNLATNLLIEKIGLERIQAWIIKQGLKETRIQRKMMDFEARAAGYENVTSPVDMMLFMQKLATGTLVQPEADRWMLDILYRSEDLEKIPYYFKWPIKVANKPGELPGTRSDVAYLHDNEHELVMGLFCDHLLDEYSEVAADEWLAKCAQILWQILTA